MVADCSNVLFAHFAGLLEYPDRKIMLQGDECEKILAKDCPLASEALHGFYAFARSVSLNRLEEIYTSTFDLQGNCSPHVGHHLFGESYKRSWFMARLNEEYNRKGFDIGHELPDHVSVILRFLATGDNEEFNQVLKDEGLKPAVEKMVLVLSENAENPYRKVLQSLLLLLQALKSQTTTSPIGPINGGMGDD